MRVSLSVYGVYEFVYEYHDHINRFWCVFYPGYPDAGKMLRPFYNDHYLTSYLMPIHKALL